MNLERVPDEELLPFSYFKRPFCAFSQVLSTIAEVHATSSGSFTLDPHSAIAVAGARNYLKRAPASEAVRRRHLLYKRFTSRLNYWIHDVL